MLGRIQKIKGFAALLVMVAAIGIAAMPQTVSAAPGNPSYCDASIERLTNSNIGSEVPVILVHGFMGKQQDWGSVNRSTDFAGRINNIPGVAVAHLFGYNTYNWVDSQDSGPKLAKTIDCVSRLSLQNGGKGKVIVVGYSMGGLVARDALSRRSTDNQRAIADQVSQVITIGTPHIGTNLPLFGQLVPVPLWGAFTMGSPELARLPHFPAQTTVRTIAGDVTKVYYNMWGQEVKRERPYDDTLVSTLSAHAEYTIDFNKGGGDKTISCEKKYRARTFIAWYTADGVVPCEHTQLTHSASNGVREDTIEAIKKHVAWLHTPPAITSLTVGPLTTTYNDDWKDAEYGASGPGEDASANDKTNTAACTNCGDTTPVPQSYAFVSVVNMGWCSGDLLNCITGEMPRLGAAPAITVGGRTPDSATRFEEWGYQGTALAWCFDDENICITYRRGVDTPQLEVSAALLHVFSTATWGNP